MKTFCYMGSLACCLLVFFTKDNILFGLFLSIVASIGYCGSIVFYNAYLPEIAEDGGLIAYGPRISSVWGDQLTRLFQKLVQGAKPADLPVERPTRVDLVINLKTARALALSVPQTLLAQASDVVE